MGISNFVTVGNIIQLMRSNQDLILINNGRDAVFCNTTLFKDTDYKLIEAIPTDLQNKYIDEISSNDDTIIIVINS